jgi:Skp family chaperone for outer membrane proteins
VPNLFPFKEELLRAATKRRDEVEDVKALKKRLRDSAIESRTQLLINAEKRSKAFLKAQQQEQQQESNRRPPIVRFYPFFASILTQY